MVYSNTWNGATTRSTHKNSTPVWSSFFSLSHHPFVEKIPLSSSSFDAEWKSRGQGQQTERKQGSGWKCTIMQCAAHQRSVSGHRSWPIADLGFFKSAAESISNLDEPIEVCPPFARDRNLGRPFLFIGAAWLGIIMSSLITSNTNWLTFHRRQTSIGWR